MDDQMETSRRRVCVFCASRAGKRTAYAAEAARLGALSARAGFGLVYGGAQVGLMGALADAALKEGGEVIGVIPRALENRELAHRGLTRLYVVETMHERKSKMLALSDAFVALPGGYGTLDEFFEAVTWLQLGIHSKPCILVNTGGYFDRMLGFLDFAVAEGLVAKESRSLIQVRSDSQEVIGYLDRLWSEQALAREPSTAPAP